MSRVTIFSRNGRVPWDVKDYVPYAPGVDNWDFRGPNGASSNNWPAMLVEQMREIPNLRVYSANGYYDMMCTMGQARYLFSRMPVPQDRVTVRAYPGEHGLYAADESASSPTTWRTAWAADRGRTRGA